VAGWFDEARSMWDAIRVPVAFLVAPLGAPIVLAVAVLFEDPTHLLQNPDVFAFYGGMTGAAAYVVTLLVGVPLFLILRKAKLTEFWVAPVVGGLLPWIAGLIFFGPMPASLIAQAVLSGAAVGTILWVIARPDRDEAPSSGSPN
jgi:uncharacterized oligopeptide transporter (OPT) family protein